MSEHDHDVRDTVDPAATLDFAALRARLAGEKGRRFWRSLEEIADSPDFQQFLEKEFPRQAAPLDGTIDRRDFLKLMSASLALAGLSACTRQPEERVLPYVKAVEEIIPGVPLYFASAMPLGGSATGILVESHMGRPTKIEGNPQHPASLGATDAQAQAAILEMYDPERSQVLTSAGEIRPWSAFVTELRAVLEGQRRSGGAGLRLLTPVVTSPTLAAQIEELLRDFPQAKWHQWEPVARNNVLAGTQLAFGAPFDLRWHVERAAVVVSLDGDPFGHGPGSLRYAREFAAGRRPGEKTGTMSRLYVAESTPTLTGTLADHRLPVRASDVESLAAALATALGARGLAGTDAGPHAAWVEAVAGDLQAHRGRSLIVAGDHQPPTVHALVHAMNQLLGNVGQTVSYIEPVAARPVDTLASIRDLVTDMDAERVHVLLILGGNPVYDAPADLGFAARLAKVAFRIHLGLYEDETSLLCHWHVPEAHFLESWSDTRTFDGTVTLIQPLIAPLYEGRTAHEVLAACSAHPERLGYDVLRETWKQRIGAADFERVWRRALHDGIVPDTAAPIRTPQVRSEWVARVTAARVAPRDGDLELLFQPDPSVYDGRFANNGWLQEVPRPHTKLTWDNAALVSVATAERLGLQNEDVVELAFHGRKVTAPVWILPGQANDVVTVHLGYGRTRVGRVGEGVGFDAYQLRTTETPWFGRGLVLRKTGEHHPIACTQHHHSMYGRDLVRAGTLADWRAGKPFGHHGDHGDGPLPSLYPAWPYEGHKWGMAIDLSSCIGCNACVVACQAENNIPVVGKDQVARGREMQWIRIDRYWEGELDNPTTRHQPVLCMHCEKAPCEVVCPVNATVHDSEGLNNMVYNRCVGTKYCSNNCPYKVRRFNFFLYSDWTTESLKLMRNPDVTVRSRGVMEKCSYCVQRINHVRIAAKRENRPIRDGEVVTACQQACPTEAIVFGDLNDADSRVAKLKESSRNYGLLAELNTIPRTTYLAALSNPNPTLAAAAPHDVHDHDAHGTEPEAHS